jgi:AhpD family alkylhydroperoxidase
MDRITPLDPHTTAGAAKLLFDGVRAKLGAVPNLVRVLGHAPNALSGYLGFGAALAAGGFDARLREQLALTIAESNQCGYCLSAHAFLGAKAGLTAQEIGDARCATASEDRADAVLKLARAIVVQRGEIGADGIGRARAAGLTDGDIIETIAHVALNIFTNYVNHVAGTPIDFPEVRPGDSQTSARRACA